MSKEERQAAQIIIILENGQLSVTFNGNMAPSQMIAGIEILKWKILNNVLAGRGSMPAIPGMLRADLKRVPS